MPTNLAFLNKPDNQHHNHIYIEISDVMLRTGDDIPILYLLCD